MSKMKFFGLRVLFIASILFAVAFLFLVLAIVLPLVFKERVFINNYYFHGLGMQGVTTNSASEDASLHDFRDKFKDFTRTFEIGILQTCIDTKYNFGCGKTYDGEILSLPGSVDSSKIKIGKICFSTPWSFDQALLGTDDFSQFTYSVNMVNESLVFDYNMSSEASATALPQFPNIPGSPFPFPGTGNGGTQSSVYDSNGKSAFFKNLNFQTFNAARVFAIIALILAFIILVLLIVVFILECLKCVVHHALLKLIQWLIIIMLIFLALAIILLIVIYHDTISFLFDQCFFLSIFAFDISFWFFWVALVLALIVLLLLFALVKFLIFCNPHHHHHCHHHHHHPHHPHHHPCVGTEGGLQNSMEMASPPSSFTYMPASSPTAPPASSSFV